MSEILTDSGIAIRDNVHLTVTDAASGRIVQRVSGHNTALSFSLDAFMQWLAGANNTGYNALIAPTQMELGDGTGATFTPVAGTLKTISYTRYQGSGQMIAVAQWVASDPAGTFTQYQWQDVSGNPWFFFAPATAVSKTSAQNLTLQWTVTATNG